MILDIEENMEDETLQEIRKRRRNEKSRDSLSPTRKPILRGSQFTAGSSSKLNSLRPFHGVSTSSDKIPTTPKPLIESQILTKTQQDHNTARTGSSHHSAASSAGTAELLGRCRGYSMTQSDEVILLESRAQNPSRKNQFYRTIPDSETQQTYAETASQTEQIVLNSKNNQQHPCGSCQQFQEMVYKLIAENKRLQGINRQKKEKILKLEEDYGVSKDQLLQAEENILILSAEIRALKGGQQQQQSNAIFTPLLEYKSIIPDSKALPLSASSSKSFNPSIPCISYHHHYKSPIQNIPNHSSSLFNQHNTSDSVGNVTNKLLHRSQNGLEFQLKQENNCNTDNNSNCCESNMNQVNSQRFSHSTKRKNKNKLPNYNSVYQINRISSRNSSLQDHKSSSSKLDLQFLNLHSKNNHQPDYRNSANLTNNSPLNNRYKNFNKSTERQSTNRLSHESKETFSFHISQPGRSQTDLLPKDRNPEYSVKDPAGSSNQLQNLHLENSSLSDGHSNVLQQLNSNRIESTFFNYAKSHSNESNQQHSNNCIANYSNETRASRSDHYNSSQQKQQSFCNSNGKNKLNYSQRENYSNRPSSISPYPLSCDSNKLLPDENSNPLLSCSLKQPNAFKQHSPLEEDRHSSVSSQQVYSFGGSQSHSSIPQSQNGDLKAAKNMLFLQKNAHNFLNEQLSSPAGEEFHIRFQTALPAKPQNH